MKSCYFEVIWAYFLEHANRSYYSSHCFALDNAKAKGVTSQVNKLKSGVADTPLSV